MKGGEGVGFTPNFDGVKGLAVLPALLLILRRFMVQCECVGCDVVGEVESKGGGLVLEQIAWKRRMSSPTTFVSTGQVGYVALVR